MSSYRNFETTKEAADASVADTASQTTWTPATGQRIRLNALLVSAGAAAKLEVYLGSRRLMTLRFSAAGSTQLMEIPSPGDLGAADGALTIKNVTGGAVNVSSAAWGREES